jgi:hypothetical protein
MRKRGTGGRTQRAAFAQEKGVWTDKVASRYGDTAKLDHG